ncbi:transketolase [Lachnospiraceae bacterium]|nr:transketolase [Lachnospiraceae bacterium]
MQEITKKNSRVWSRLGQRGTVCGVALLEILESMENAYVLTADLGHTSGLDRVMQKFPQRFINVGISEQNLVGTAAGLALDGGVAFATTFATFLTMRSYEQIRHNAGYQEANVKLIGTSAGFAIGMFGNTHYSYEDIALMRVIPNMVVVSPADATEAYLAIHQAAVYQGPVYIRLSDGLNTAIVHSESYAFEIGKAELLNQGKDIAIIAVGGVVHEAINAVEKLQALGINPTLINMHTIKPLDEAMLYELRDYRALITVEEHSIIGGLGSAVAEYMMGISHTTQLFRIGIQDKFVHPGEQGYVKSSNGLDAEGIYAYVKRVAESFGSDA